MRDIIAIIIQSSSILLISYLVGLITRKYLSNLWMNKNSEQDNPMLEGVITHSKIWGRYGIGVLFFIVGILLVTRYTSIVDGTMIDAYIMSCILAFIPIVTIPFSYRFKIRFNQDFLEVRRSFGLRYNKLYYDNVTIEHNIEFLIIKDDKSNKSYMIGFTEPGVISLELLVRDYHRKINKPISKEKRLSSFYKPLLMIFTVCSIVILGLGVLAVIDNEVEIAWLGISVGTLILLLSIVSILYYTNVSIEILGEKVLIKNLLGKTKKLQLNELSYSNRKYGVVLYQQDVVVFRSIGKLTNPSIEIEAKIKHK